MDTVLPKVDVVSTLVQCASGHQIVCTSYLCDVAQCVCNQRTIGNNLFVSTRVRLRTSYPSQTSPNWVNGMFLNLYKVDFAAAVETLHLYLFIVFRFL